MSDNNAYPLDEQTQALLYQLPGDELVAEYVLDQLVDAELARVEELSAGQANMLGPRLAQLRLTKRYVELLIATRKEKPDGG